MKKAINFFLTLLMFLSTSISSACNDVVLVSVPMNGALKKTTYAHANLQVSSRGLNIVTPSHIYKFEYDIPAKTWIIIGEQNDRKAGESQIHFAGGVLRLSNEDQTITLFESSPAFDKPATAIRFYFSYSFDPRSPSTDFHNIQVSPFLYDPKTLAELSGENNMGYFEVKHSANLQIAQGIVESKILMGSFKEVSYDCSGNDASSSQSSLSRFRKLRSLRSTVIQK